MTNNTWDRTVLVPQTQDGSSSRCYQHAYMDWFVDQVLYTRVDQQLTARVLEAALAVRTPEFDKRTHLAGDQSEGYALITPTSMNIDHDLAQEIYHAIVTPLVNDVVKNSRTHLQLEELWYNIQKSGEYNPPHTHGGSFSFVWYLDIPEQIRQEHTQQLGTMQTRGLIDFLSTHTNDVLRFNPQTSDLFIFRADHKHQVYPFYSDLARISMSGNLLAQE